jgi:hypothetical protein
MRLNYRCRHGRVLVFMTVTMIALISVLSSCATQPAAETYNPPRFFLGLLHGFPIVFSFIGSLFTNVRIYNFPNSGVWYDLGYLIGAGAFLSGSGASA